ncbi:hypothetical protein EYZ11_011422 [Aspergillus tanneri]|uniref:Uncharacterized protein n=1 Tax=Aspergillus tanneri TaxID=1220188 RepID=A0A4S3J504_9EURO|nr:hypothetical protein EYZ11_011422 [Aspergillus tanneri]
MLARANSLLETLKSISGSTWGGSLTAMRKIYRAVAHTRPEFNKIIDQFTKIQKRAAIIISGAFKGTAAVALDAELHLLPIRLQMQKTIEETAIRIQTGPWAKNAVLAPTAHRKTAEKWETRKAFVLAPSAEHFIAFTDGSGHSGHVGTDNNTTVYTAELTGMGIALSKVPTRAAAVTVFADSQAAIQAVDNPGRPSGQY